MVLGLFCKKHKVMVLFLSRRPCVTLQLEGMRLSRTVLVMLLTGTACAGLGWGQAMTEAAAAAAGGSVGGVAGKKVSDGLTSIFNKVDKQTSKAAGVEVPSPPSKKDELEPILDVGPGVPKVQSRQPDSVPPPPPIPSARHAATAPRRPASAPTASPALLVAPAPPPPPPAVTADDLKSVTAGMNRDDVLKLGPPASRITMFDDGHVVEVYRYQTGDSPVGVVRLTDGAVSSTQVR